MRKRHWVCVWDVRWEEEDIMKRAERRKAHEGTGTKRAAMRRREEMETVARA